MNDFNKLIMGAILGSALGVLFAPEKGENTRKNLQGKANQTMDKFRGTVSNTADDLEGLKLKIEDKLKELSMKTSNGMEDGFQKERDKINKIIDDLKDYIDKNEASNTQTTLEDELETT